jgi:hypothetical protein
MNLKALVPFRDRLTLAWPELNVFGSLQREVDHLAVASWMTRRPHKGRQKLRLRLEVMGASRRSTQMESRHGQGNWD